MASKHPSDFGRYILLYDVIYTYFYLKESPLGFKHDTDSTLPLLHVPGEGNEYLDVDVKPIDDDHHGSMY